VKRLATAAALAVAMGLMTAPAAAQYQLPTHPVEEGVRLPYEAIDASVVRVRTIATLEQEVADPLTGELSTISRPLSVYGTAVVIGEVYLDGRWEYLVLTNHHVADVSNYVISDGRFLRENKHNTRAVPTVPEESYLVTEEREEIGEDDILLIEVARNPRGDMTLLRTVGATRELTPFRGSIGYRDGQVRPGASVITSGFPYTGGKILAMGTVREVDRLHELGQPHEDFVVDLPVERGQSGSPVFMVETVQTAAGPQPQFTLIGLLHASEKGERFMVPYGLWKESLVGLPETLAYRLVR
jgi:hypothetical protein